MPKFNMLDNEQRRQLIDTQQVFEAFEAKRSLFSTRFSGSMRWVERNGSEYLLRKRGRTETSLGSRSSDTEQAYRQFKEGRDKTSEEMRTLESRLARMAAVNSALGLGRVPRMTARLLRRLHDVGLLGKHLHVVGTNALFAYEARAGIRFESSLLATGDADLLMDARRKLSLALSDVRREGVLGILQKADTSFARRGPRDFRAVNRDGYFVDLIKPAPRNMLSSKDRATIGEPADDLHGAPIHGLSWLVSAPKFGAVALDENGYPVRIETVDPRAFALHKEWVSKQRDRDPIKAPRDHDQSAAVAFLCERHLNLSFDSDDLSAMPLELRAQASLLLGADSEEERGPEDEDGKPKWW